MHVAILYFGSISRISGTDERVLQIAKGLADHGVKVTLSGAVDYSVDSRYLEKIQVISRPKRVLNLTGVFVWISQLVTNGLVCKYDIIQIESFSLFRSLLLFLIMKPFSRKRVIVFHDKMFGYDPRKSLIGRFNLILQKILLTIFDASITPGQSVKKWFQELHGELVHSKMIVVPNGTPDLDMRRDVSDLLLRGKYKINPHAFLILFFGTMTFPPNWDAAMRLYDLSSSVSDEFERITRKKLVFIVGGMGSEILPKTECFVPLGFVEKLDELLSLPDVIVFPHTPSSSGPHVKTVYAFLSKRPVIATEDAIKDLPQAIPGKHFLLFDILKPDTLLGSILEVYNNKERGENLASNAYQYAKMYSWEKISLSHFKLYEKLLCKSD